MANNNPSVFIFNYLCFKAEGVGVQRRESKRAEDLLSSSSIVKTVVSGVPIIANIPALYMDTLKS